MTLLYLEIFLVIIAVLAMAAAGMSALRNAVIFGRTLRAAASQAGTKLLLINKGAYQAQERWRLVSRAAFFLKQRLAVLGFTLGKMWILISALGEARRRLDPLLDYLGL